MANPYSVRFIGDVHGKYSQYKKIMKDSPFPTIQVGDMGVGFKDYLYEQDCANPPYDVMEGGDHRFIRGNHDNPAVCAKHSQWIEDGTFNVDYRVMYVGGALSIDKEWRREGYDWWADEELSDMDLGKIIIAYKLLKPKMMVTHTCPEEVANAIIQQSGNGWKIPTRSEAAFQEMFAAHQPELWVFGHWHTHYDFCHNRTRFVCLNELETFDATYSA